MHHSARFPASWSFIEASNPVFEPTVKTPLLRRATQEPDSNQVPGTFVTSKTVPRYVYTFPYGTTISPSQGIS